MKNNYSKELIEYAKEKSKILTKEQLKLELQNKFNIKIDKRNFKYFTYHHNIYCTDYKPLIKYNREILDYAKNNSDKLTIDEMQKELKEKFNLETTRHNLQVRLQSYRIYCINDRKKEIGSEFIRDDGKVIIKTSEGKWKHKARVMYEKYHNLKLKDDERIIFLNQDKTDFRKNNLKKISKRESLTMSGGKLYSTNKKLTELGILTTQLLIKAKEKGKMTY